MPSFSLPLRRRASAQEEAAWFVGGRYTANRSGVMVYGNPELDGKPVQELKKEDSVLLLGLVEGPAAGGPPIGLVAPSGNQVSHGWVRLEEGVNGQGHQSGPPFLRQRREGSWEMGARYFVKNPATLRMECSLYSEQAGELQPNDEVLVLELGVHDNQGDGKARLRTRVATDSGLIAWMSPETASGELLLLPVNLLSEKVVDLHRRSLGGGGGLLRATLTGNLGKEMRRSADGAGGGAGPRTSHQPGGPVPWQVGGKYRVLEKMPLRREAALSSAKICEVPATALVSVRHVESVPCPHLGMCPCALVLIENGPTKGHEGWVRCAAKDGHDLVDARDQLEFDKVLQRLQRQEQSGQSSRQRPSIWPGSEADEQQEPGSAGLQGPPAVPKATGEAASPPAGRSPPAEGRSGLGALDDDYRDERLIADQTVTEYKSVACCGCSPSPNRL